MRTVPEDRSSTCSSKALRNERYEPTNFPTECSMQWLTSDYLVSNKTCYKKNSICFTTTTKMLHFRAKHGFWEPQMAKYRVEHGRDVYGGWLMVQKRKWDDDLMTIITKRSRIVHRSWIPNQQYVLLICVFVLCADKMSSYISKNDFWYC